MKHKKIVLLVIIVLAISFFGIGCLLLFNKNYKTNATKTQMNEMNMIINKYYYRYAKDLSVKNEVTDEDVLNMILYQFKSEDKVLKDKEKYKIKVDFSNRVYSLIREYIDYKMKELYDIEIDYNFINSSVTNNDVMVVDEEKVYYTVPKDTYMYFVTNYEENGNEYDIDVLEYKVTTSNKADLEKDLADGKIPRKYKSTNKYNMIIEKQDDYYKLIFKKTY